MDNEGYQVEPGNEKNGDVKDSELSSIDDTMRYPTTEKPTSATTDIENPNTTGSNGTITLPQPVGDGTVRMKRQIGLLGGTSMIVGTMIGSGIFVSPSGLLDRTGSVALSLVVWAGCGILATFTAISYCELGTVVPRSGGEHAYYMATFVPPNSNHSRILKFFGELPAFLFAWMTILLLKPSSLSIISLSFAQYALSSFLSGYCDDFKDTDDYFWTEKMLAVCIATFVATVNILSAKVATRVQIIFTGTKILAMLVIIGIGIYNVSRGEYGAFKDLDWKEDIENSGITYGKIAVAFYSGLWAYEGWNNLNFVTEELENPAKNLPLSILLAIPLVTGLYLLVNFSYLSAFPNKEALINSDAVAVSVGDANLGPMKWLMPLLVTLSTIGSANGSMYTAGRISYVAGRDGHMVDILSYVHALRLTPTIAITLNTLLAIPMIFASDISKLIDFFSFAAWIFYGLALGCVIILRFTQPKANRPFKVPIVLPVLAVLVSIFLVIAPLVDDPTLEYFYVLGFSVIGCVIYYPFVYLKRRLPFMDQLTKGIQYLTLVAPSPYKED